MKYNRKHSLINDIKNKALKCRNRTEFNRKYNRLYYYATKLGLLDKLFGRPFKNRLTKEQVIEQLSKYKTRGQLFKRNANLYFIAKRANLLERIPLTSKRTFWNHTSAWIECQTIKHYKDFRNKEGLYAYCKRNGLTKQYTKHMIRKLNKCTIDIK
jgi:hypothetical protein